MVWELIQNVVAKERTTGSKSCLFGFLSLYSSTFASSFVKRPVDRSRLPETNAAPMMASLNRKLAIPPWGP